MEFTVLDGILGGGFQSPPPNNTPPPSSSSPSSQTPSPSQSSTGQQTQPSAAAPEEDTRPEDIDDGTYKGTAPSDADDSDEAQPTADNSTGTTPPASAPTGNPPAAAAPAAPQPTESQPAPSDPVATRPVVAQPPYTQPATQKPAASKPSQTVTAPVADPTDTGGDVTVTDHVTAFLNQVKEIQDRYASVSLAEKDKTRQRAETMMQALLASQMIESMANPKNFGGSSVFDNSDRTDEADSLAVQWYKEA